MGQVPRHIAAVPIRWSDVDQLGHVNNVAFLRYLQEARVDMLFVNAAERGTDDLARGVVVHRHEIAYRAPMEIRPDPAGRPRPARVDTWAAKVGAASFELGYELRAADGTVCAVASSVLVPYELAEDRIRRLTPAERAFLDGFQADGPTPGDRSPASWTDGGTPYATSCAPRFDDLDSYGHVNNVALAEYLQQARIDFGQGPLADARGTHERAVVARLRIDYLRPIPFRTEPLRVELRVTRIGKSSFDLAYQVRDADAVFARGASTMVAYDVTAGRSRPLTEAERVVLKGFCQS
jgi:acyl-CoA thioester hydrolase